ncbi:MAG: TonB family protein [Bdellovibrionales bacterium]
MFKKLQRPLVVFVLGSLILHAFFWLGLTLNPSVPKRPAQEQVQVEILEIDPATRDNMQIVEQKDRLNEEKDEDSKFLSAFDQKVKKQTRAANQGPMQNAAARSQVAPQQAQNKKSLPSLSSLAPQFKPQPVQPQITGDEGKQNQAAQTDDYLKDVAVDMQTMLSTREFVYYTYYSRIKERIRQHWEPTVRGKVKMIYRQGRSIASSKDHVTQVVITLNNLGELMRVDVVTPSGLEQLDDAAVEAFRAAQPFPNPPRGLINDDGVIQIRWDFVLEANNDVFPNNHTDQAEGYGHESNSSRGL